MHFRDSQYGRYPIPFPFPDFFLPAGETQGALETPQAGDYFEMSRFTLMGLFERGSWTARAKVDVIDLYERNPTSSDRQWDIDELWLRFGDEVEPDLLPFEGGYYVKLGKFGKFERQDDRHLVSYGLASTVFNRLEDAGLEGGIDIGRNFFAKLSYTTGNPLFIRDPNALAGDNGTPQTNPFEHPFPDPEIKNGIVLLYDADIEDVDFKEPELGVGLGFRLGDDFGRRTLTGMLSYYQRDLQDSVDMGGTFYGGDLDLLLGVDEFDIPPPIALDGREKNELTATVWLYFEEGTLFVQAVDSEVAGLDRSAYEGELSWTFKLPLWWAFNQSQILPAITPAIRYSKLDPDFAGDIMTYPAPSVWWEWKKLDVGFTARLYRGWRMTFEYTDSQFLRGGKWEHGDEFLTTLRWRWMSSDAR